MKKILKIFGVVLLVTTIVITVLLIYIVSKPAVPTDYQQSTEVGGEVEAKYMARGNFGIRL